MHMGLTSFPHHSQIISYSCADFSPQLIWEWPGNEATHEQSAWELSVLYVNKTLYGRYGPYATD